MRDIRKKFIPKRLTSRLPSALEKTVGGGRTVLKSKLLAKGSTAPLPVRGAGKPASYLGECPRDKEGHCLPRNAADQSGQGGKKPESDLDFEEDAFPELPPGAPAWKPPMEESKEKLIKAGRGEKAVAKMKERLKKVAELGEGKHKDIKEELSGELFDATRIEAGGVSASYKVEFTSGRIAVAKPLSGEGLSEIGLSPRVGVPLGGSTVREFAAFAFAELFGFDDLVPVTVERSLELNGNLEVCSVQDFCHDANKPRKNKKGMWDGETDALRAAVFDYLTGNMDRHSGNWLMGKDGDKLRLIDNGLSFPTRFGEDDYINSKFWRHAVENKSSVPDLSSWEGKWDEAEKVLQAHGLEEDAIKLTKKRYDTLTEASRKSRESGVRYKFEDLDGFGEYETMYDVTKYADDMIKLKKKHYEKLGAVNPEVS